MGCPLSPEEILEDFKSFYFDTALSAHETTLTAIQSFITPDHLLFGTDFPGEVIYYHNLLTCFFLTGTFPP